MRTSASPAFASTVAALATAELRVAAAADLHCTARSGGAFEHWLEHVAASADVLLLCGDLTEHGFPEEAEVLARELAGFRLPVLAVLGNHDHEAGHARDVRRILERTGVVVLDGDAVELGGVGFAGVMGAGGGFVYGGVASEEAQREARKLDRALAALSTPCKLALMHYAPVADTLRGEPEHLHPMLGSSALAEPLSTHGVAAVFHGHAHRGIPHGYTSGGTPVYNAALPVLRRFGDPLRPFHRVSVSHEPLYSTLNLSGLSPSQATPTANC
jgi:Icc-related predicted phosphoesterase